MAIKQPETAAMGSVGESGEDLVAKSSNKISEANIRPLRNGADLNGSIDSYGATQLKAPLPSRNNLLRAEDRKPPITKIDIFCRR